jgi:hypothetical protein
MKPDKKEPLAAAFAAALAEMPSPALDKVNSAFGRFKYASLGSFLETCRPHLARFGLALASDFEPMPDGNLMCWTVIRDASGETIRLAPVPVRVDLAKPQATGSAMTYARRYSLSAALGVVGDEDDDGNATNEPKPQRQVSMPQAHAAAAPKPQAKPAAKPVEPVELDDGWERVTVEKVETKDGQSAKGPWRLYSVFTAGGERFSTFSATHGGRALELVGQAADVLVKESGRGIELLDIRGAKSHAKPIQPAITKEASDDEIPF